MHKPSKPTSEKELLARAQNLAGLTLGEIATQFDIAVPRNLKKEKGWVGLLLEHALGATAGSRPEPDFVDLGIELKSIPINHAAKPLETTFVCVAPLTGLVGTTWNNCHLKHKLTRVLWVPVIAERHIPVAERIVCTPFLWSPNEYEESLMAQDWQELTDMIVLGNVENINGKHGQVLQLRPKAANSSAKTKAYNSEGKPFMTLPRGFYLKTNFTQYLINHHLCVV
ncbi:DNA mismatch repair endonuclease MutH [Thalassotalea sediminis]|uniref:DNA mismatch repair endonuclease MutH n=1 Tax=Thalassotalea sediminis TaxID=1759089 RepID=UPI002574025B|nr:DNA mismatch repair endonuclease MutH [Thalassotalea sediminis]